MDKNIISGQETAELLLQHSMEYAVIKNPDFVFPAYEYVPLAPKITTPRDELCAVIMDLNGTSVNFDELSLFSLEKVLRKISGRITKESWAGLDHIIDYPNILGLHPKKQVEFLISRYHNFINQEYLKETYFYSILWTLILDYNKHRQETVRKNLIRFGCKDILTDPKFLEYLNKNKFDKNSANVITNYIILKYGKCLAIHTYMDTITIALDIFYQQIHEILTEINNTEKGTSTENIHGIEGKNFIEPAPGLGAVLALIKGWLEEDVKFLFDPLHEQLKTKFLFPFKPIDIDITKNKLVTISEKFRTNPIKTAIITTSTFFEADVLLKEVFRVLTEQLESWQIPSKRKSILKERFSRYENVFDIIVTSDDTSEIRLKPHRDLYSIALSKLEIPKEKHNQVLGFEDSENGIIGLRAAGIGLCAAAPVNKIVNIEFPSAAYSLNGGMLEALLSYNLFLK